MAYKIGKHFYVIFFVRKASDQLKIKAYIAEMRPDLIIGRAVVTLAIFIRECCGAERNIASIEMDGKKGYK